MKAEEQVLKEAEAIVEAEGKDLAKLRFEHEMQVITIERMSSITHQQAHQAMNVFGANMIKAAETAGMEPQAFIDSMPDSQRWVLIGMCIGGVLAGGELDFDVDPNAPRPDGH